jgi:PAS domain S-box-containing protein
VIVDADGDILFANNRAGEILGRAPNVLRGTPHTELGTLADLDGDERPPDDWPFSNILAEEEPVSGERYMFERDDGTVRYLSVNGAPLRDSTGNVRQVVFSIEDITDQVQHERELKAAKEEAERANKLKAAFFANVTHDLRTPLTSIIGSAEMLAQNTPEEFQSSINRIERSSRRLLATINSVLDLSKLETGAVDPELESVDLVDEVLGTAEVFHPQAAEQDITLETEVAADTIPVKLDSTMLHRILDNLTSNALKFTEPGGTVVLRADATNDAAIVEVEDTGVGIKEAYRSRLFESFSREDDVQDTDGSGLGLPITKRLTELMGGTIEVESERGVGTTFTVRFPR